MESIEYEKDYHDDLTFYNHSFSFSSLDFRCILQTFLSQISPISGSLGFNLCITYSTIYQVHGIFKLNFQL